MSGKAIVTIINYGMGNLRSVANAVEYLGHTPCVTADPDAVRRAEKLILPGVGAFAAGTQQLRARGLVEPIGQAAQAGTHLLGICLGMQMFMRRSTEFGVHDGLAFLQGDVCRMDAESFGLPLPHIGWNVTSFAAAHPVVAGLPEGQCFYYVNSYACLSDETSDVLATFEYGRPYAAVVARENVVGVQFHPEKSQAHGLALLRKFLDW